MVFSTEKQLGARSPGERESPPWHTERSAALGGEIVQPVGVDAPELTARFRDPGGNIIGLYEEPRKKK